MKVLRSGKPGRGGGVTHASVCACVCKCVRVRVLLMLQWLFILFVIDTDAHEESAGVPISPLFPTGLASSLPYLVPVEKECVREATTCVLRGHPTARTHARAASSSSESIDALPSSHLPLVVEEVELEAKCQGEVHTRHTGKAYGALGLQGLREGLLEVHH